MVSLEWILCNFLKTSRTFIVDLNLVWNRNLISFTKTYRSRFCTSSCSTTCILWLEIMLYSRKSRACCPFIIVIDKFTRIVLFLVPHAEWSTNFFYLKLVLLTNLLIILPKNHMFVAKLYCFNFNSKTTTIPKNLSELDGILSPVFIPMLRSLCSNFLEGTSFLR